jgi:predicted Zn-dependent peptidase
MDVRTRVLPNGLTIASVRLAGFRTAAVGAFVRVGSRDEPAPLNGISHFLEHMAFKGTETRDARRISLEIERVGASMNAYTAKDHTAYHTVLLAEHMPVALDVLADVIRRSTFPAEEIERERQVILQELGDAADDPDADGSALAQRIEAALADLHSVAGSKGADVGSKGAEVGAAGDGGGSPPPPNPAPPPRPLFQGT